MGHSNTKYSQLPTTQTLVKEIASQINDDVKWVERPQMKSQTTLSEKKDLEDYSTQELEIRQTIG